MAGVGVGVEVTFAVAVAATVAAAAAVCVGSRKEGGSPVAELVAVAASLYI